MSAADLLQTCRKLGVSLQPRGEGLAIRPANRIAPELLAQIRAHKPALLALLDTSPAVYQTPAQGGDVRNRGQSTAPQAGNRENTSSPNREASDPCAKLSADCVPWLHVARQVLAGEFDGGDRCLLDSLLIGVRNIPHPLCQQARARLEMLLNYNRKEARR